MAQRHQRQQRLWLEWLREGPVPRHVVIRNFVSNGLIPFLNGKGYVIAGTESELRSMIATVLYRGKDTRCLAHDLSAIRGYNDSYAQEDLIHFYDTITDEDWDAVWAAWSAAWPDISLESEYGWDRRQDLQIVIWRYIDIMASPQTRVLDSMLVDDDNYSDDEEYRRRHQVVVKEDVYIREAAESGEWGGYRR